MRSRIIDWMKRIILDLPFNNTSRKPIDEIMESIRGQESGRDIKPLEPLNPRTLEILESSIRETIMHNFEDLLENFYDFNVSTIDSFVNLTLKASAFKLNLPPDFDISTDSYTHIDFVLQECLQNILEDDEVRGKFDRFLKYYIELEGENISWIPKDSIRNIISSLWTEEVKENSCFTNKINFAFMQSIQTKIQDSITELKSYLCSTAGIKVHSGLLNALERFSVSSKYGFKISAFMKKPTLKESLNKNSAPVTPEYEKLWRDIKNHISLFLEVLSESRYASYIEIYELFKQILQEEITLRKQVILIEQLNALLQKIINDKHFIPEIYYALAERYSHFLIDEFQDTNHLQWNNIDLLAEEALSRGGTLFLVGDKKQAIYRWRGGKSELVDEISSRYFNYPVYELMLKNNYRSGEYIVNFNNIIFSPNNLRTIINSIVENDPEGLADKILSTYEMSAQKVSNRLADKGYVHIERLIQENDEGEAKETFLKEEKNELIKKKIKRLMEDLNETKRFEYKDIAILVRRKEEVQLIANVLLEMGISVESDLTVNIKNNSLIQEMISFLTFINSVDDNLSLAGFLTGKIFLENTGMGSDEIMSWISNERISSPSRYLYLAFQDNFPKIWNTYFDYFFRNSGYLPLYDFVVIFLKKWRVLNNFPEDAAYFFHVCEMIKEREILQQNNITNFLEFLRENQKNEEPFLINTANQTNAIKVMTIHKAKGLQFQVVILPFLKLTTYGSSDSKDKTKYFVRKNSGIKLLYINKYSAEFSEKLKATYSKSEAEYILDEINNIYVGCTRAEKELYIFLTEAKRQKNHLIKYLFGLHELNKYTNENIIEMGRKMAESFEHVTDANLKPQIKQGLIMQKRADDETDKINEENQLFDDLGKDNRWMEFIRAKIDGPGGISPQNIFAKKKGDVIHYILSLITKLPEDWTTFIDKHINTGAAKYGLDSYKPIINETLINAFNNAEIKRFFQPEDSDVVYTEREIVDTIGTTYKIDRIVLTCNHIDIIDFKTGESHSGEHSEQLLSYGRIVQSMYPGKDIKRYLIYIDTCEVKTV